MSFHQRISFSALALATIVATLSAGLSPRKAPGAVSPFGSDALPWRALGDFDGDGRVDMAIIQAGADRRISVLLSGSSSAVRLDAPVTGVVEGDIDHDGDLDLVAATSSGDVLIWLNDGHGRFTRLPVSRTRSLSGEPNLNPIEQAELMAVGVGAPLLPPPTLAETTVVASRIRAPAGQVAGDVRCLILPALRAPPARFV